MRLCTSLNHFKPKSIQKSLDRHQKRLVKIFITFFISLFYKHLKTLTNGHFCKIEQDVLARSHNHWQDPDLKSNLIK